MSIPDEVVTKAGYADYNGEVVCDFITDDLLRAALEAVVPDLTAKLRAEVAFQKARAEYFKYAPEIEDDPEGVQELVEEMRAARRALQLIRRGQG